MPPPGFGDVVAVNETPPPYVPQYAEQVRLAANVGYTITELCRMLGVGLDTVNLWRLCYPDFDAAMRANLQARTDRVEQAWFQRAVGYDHPGEKIFCTDGVIRRAETLVHVPADPSAAMNWMKVHRPDVYSKVGEQAPSVEVSVVNVTQVRTTIEGKLARLAERVGAAGVPGLPDA